MKESTVIYTRTSENDTANEAFEKQVDACLSYAGEHGLTVITSGGANHSLCHLVEDAVGDGCDIIVIVRQRN